MRTIGKGGGGKGEGGRGKGGEGVGNSMRTIALALLVELQMCFRLTRSWLDLYVLNTYISGCSAGGSERQQDGHLHHHVISTGPHAYNHSGLYIPDSREKTFMMNEQISNGANEGTSARTDAQTNEVTG